MVQLRVKKSLFVKSFGLGIMYVEGIQALDQAGSNGDSSEKDREILSFVQSAGILAVESIVDLEDSNRAYLLMPDGHEPSPYEFSQMGPDDWARLRAAVSARGSTTFLARLSALEGALRTVPAG